MRSDAAGCSHLVASSISRTVKFLTALSVVRGVVIPEWIEQCARAGHFIGNGIKSLLYNPCSSSSMFSSQSTELSSCHIRSDRQTTSLTLTTGVCEAGTKMRGASNMNIHYDVTCFTDCSVEVTLRSDFLGRLNQL